MKKTIINKKDYLSDIQDIKKSIFKHEKNEEEKIINISENEIRTLEANMVWAMNNINIPFEQWRSMFIQNSNYLKRLSDISMTYNFDIMVRDGEAVELITEGSKKTTYMKKEEYERLI